MQRHVFYWAACLALRSGATAQAQQLLWEKTISHATSAITEEGVGTMTDIRNQRLTVLGCYVGPQLTPTCRPRGQVYYQTYNLNGTLLREQLGRLGVSTGESIQSPAPAAGGGYWWTWRGGACIGNATAFRGYVQRLNAQGDTVKGWYLGPVPPRHTATAVLARRNTLVVAGYVLPTGAPNQQIQQYRLSCLDTLTGQLRWQHDYPTLPQAFDYCVALAPTPRGGYLLSGDSQTLTGFQHYLLETDSLGQERRRRIFSPLGPNFDSGSRTNYQCNILVLPNAQGYLLSGTADSAFVSSQKKSIGYVMRLDTALNVTWVYRHPPGLNGSNTRSQYAYKIRLLPNGTVGVMLNDVRTGYFSAYLAQLDISSGQRVGFYLLQSNTQFGFTPNDWQWVGDGTLLVCGESTQVGVSGKQGYLARFDFRSTPLATARPAAGRVPLQAYPNPAHETVTLGFGQAVAAGSRVELVALSTGRLVQEKILHEESSLNIDVAALPVGVYAARLLAADGRLLGTGRVVVVH